MPNGCSLGKILPGKAHVLGNGLTSTIRITELSIRVREHGPTCLERGQNRPLAALIPFRTIHGILTQDQYFTILPHRACQH